MKGGIFLEMFRRELFMWEEGKESCPVVVLAGKVEVEVRIT